MQLDAQLSDPVSGLCHTGRITRRVPVQDAKRCVAIDDASEMTRVRSVNKSLDVSHDPVFECHALK